MTEDEITKIGDRIVRKVLHVIEYRTKTDPPTEDGFYFARLVESRHGRLMRVVGVRFESAFFGAPAIPKVWLVGEAVPLKLEDFDWFGPVAEVREG